MVVFSRFTLHGSIDNDAPEDRVRLSCDVRYQHVADPHRDERYFGANPKGAKGVDFVRHSLSQMLADRAIG